MALYVECLAPGQSCIRYIVCMNGRSLHYGKKKEDTSLRLKSYMGTTWHDLAILEQEEKGTHGRSFLKLTISSFFSFLCFYFTASCNFWPQLVCEYASFAFLVYAWLNFNKRDDEFLLLRDPDWLRIIGGVFGSWPELHYMHYMKEMQIS